jgi:hypothetical protein
MCTIYVLSFISLYFLFYVRMEIEEINLYFSLNMIVLPMYDCTKYNFNSVVDI